MCGLCVLSVCWFVFLIEMPDFPSSQALPAFRPAGILELVSVS